MECPHFQDLFLWVPSRPCLFSGRGFSNLCTRFVYFCLPEHSGCVSLTHMLHIPYVFLVISRLLMLDLCFSQVSVVRGIFPSLYFLFRHIVFLLFNLERPKKHMISMTFCVIVSISLGYSCTESTGSSWETLPDARLPVC